MTYQYTDTLQWCHLTVTASWCKLAWYWTF